MQQKYSVTEIELLAIVETPKEFKGMLWGQDIKVYTDHKNHTRDALGLTSDRVYHWWLLLKEYAPKIIYIKGIHNTVADIILHTRMCYQAQQNQSVHRCNAWCGTRGIEHAAMEIICAPLAKLQQDQHTNASLLLSYE